MSHFLENIKVWIQYDVAHISNNVVVLVLSSVDSQDPKHDKNHCPGVDQRTHCWVATHIATAWVEAKCFG